MTFEFRLLLRSIAELYVYSWHAHCLDSTEAVWQALCSH